MAEEGPSDSTNSDGNGSSPSQRGLWEAVPDDDDPDWIVSAEDLATTDRPVDVDNFWVDLGKFDNDEINFLDKQTERTLDRHAEIQSNQRSQARAIIRLTIAIVGVFAGALPFITGFIQGLEFTTISIVRAVISMLLLLIVVGLSELVVFDTISIIDSTFDILSPEATERGVIGRSLALIGFIGPEVRDEESGSGIRSVSILDELAPRVDQPRQGLHRDVILNRHNRIRRNERVIDQNITHLHDIYQRAKLGLERGVAIVILLATAGILLGAQL